MIFNTNKEKYILFIFPVFLFFLIPFFLITGPFFKRFINFINQHIVFNLLLQREKFFLTLKINIFIFLIFGFI